MRVDRVIKFKVLKPLVGKVCELSCSGERYETSSKKVTQISKFRFDCYRAKEARWQWIHKEEEEFHGVSDVRSYSIPVTPVCAEDSVEISITMMSLMGNLNV